jgi:uncharacterized protein
MNGNTLIGIAIGICILVPLSAFLPASGTGEENDAPRLLDYITDEVGVLTYSGYYSDTYGVCEYIHANTSCEILIYVINSTDDRPIDEFAFGVFDANSIGDEKKDNGVLILVAVGDEEYFVVVGSGLEYVLNDAKVGRFAREYYVPYAEEGDVGYAIFALTVVIAWEIVDLYEESESHSYPIEGIPLEWPELILATTVLVAILILTKGKAFLWIGGSLRKWGGGRTSGGGAGGKWR